MQEIIKKAIDGGWDKDNARVYDCDGHDSQHIDELMLMDKTFWQSLGKTCGWNDESLWRAGIDGSAEWYLRAMSFHEINLTEGWDKAVEWLNDLIK